MWEVGIVRFASRCEKLASRDLPQDVRSWHRKICLMMWDIHMDSIFNLLLTAILDSFSCIYQGCLNKIYLSQNQIACSKIKIWIHQTNFPSRFKITLFGLSVCHSDHWIHSVVLIWFYLLIYLIFLAHLSRRLTRWAYSIAMVHRPSIVVRRPSSSILSNLYISEASWPT